MHSAAAIDLFGYPTPEAHKQPPFTSVTDGLKQIDDCELSSLPVERLQDDLHWMARQQRLLEAMQARYLAELERREDELPGDSATNWLQNNLGMTSHAAFVQLRTAQQLEALPYAAAALRAGHIGPQHVQVICKAMRYVPRTCLDPGTAEYDLVEAAREKDPYSLEQHWLQMRYQADQEAAVVAEAEQYDRRWLDLRPLGSGSYRIEGVLDPETGATLDTAMRAIMGRRPRDERRTATQRRVDALRQLARRPLDAGGLPERGGEKPHLMLVADLATLRLEPGSQLAQLDWGPLVTGQTARRIAEDADITPVLVNGKGDILHVGKRTRTVSPRVRRALNLRDRHCQAPGCDVKPELCTPHHIRHVVDGGRSVLPNLTLRCEVHHAREHPENDRFRKGAAVQPAAP